MGASDLVAELSNSAIEIGEEIWQERRKARDGSPIWTYAAAEGRLRPIGPFLFDGTLGLGLFFAALARSTGEERWRDRALATIRPAYRKFGDMTPSRSDALKGLGLGGHLGLGSIVWSFWQVGQLLADPSIEEVALHCTDLITECKIEQDQIFDVLLGGAGALLALSSILADTDEDGLRQKALEIAEYLVSRRLEARGFRTWKTLPEHPPLVGYTHGAAGMGYAFLRFYRASNGGYTDAIEVADQAFGFERQFWDPARGSWLDARFPDHPRVTNTWCYGTPGIGLSRLAARRLGETAEIRSDTEAAWARNLDLALPAKDDVCCGAAGFAMACLSAAAEPGFEHREVCRAHARELLAELLERRRREGSFRLVFPLEDGRSNSFFNGKAGIGYALLWAATDGSMPCPLLLEAPERGKPTRATRSCRRKSSAAPRSPSASIVSVEPTKSLDGLCSG